MLRGCKSSCFQKCHRHNQLVINLHTEAVNSSHNHPKNDSPDATIVPLWLESAPFREAHHWKPTFDVSLVCDCSLRSVRNWLHLVEIQITADVQALDGENQGFGELKSVAMETPFWAAGSWGSWAKGVCLIVLRILFFHSLNDDAGLLIYW